jgi:putative peptidoglycan lipid II flippase
MYLRYDGFNKKIISATVIIGSGSFAAKLCALASQVVIARWFGASSVLDAYYVAILVPLYAIGIFSGSFSGAVIPTYVRLRENQGQQQSQDLFARVATIAVAALAVLASLLLIAAPWVIGLVGPGFDLPQRSLTQILYFCLLPVLVIGGVSSIQQSFLEANRRFALPALASVVIPIVTVLAVAAGTSSLGIYSLVAGTLVGFCLNLVLLVPATRRCGLRIKFISFKLDPDIRLILGQYWPLVAGSALMSTNPIVDQAMASSLGPGSVASLNYGTRITAAILSIGTMALSSALLPYYASFSANGDIQAARRTLRYFVVLSLIVTIPLTSFMYVFAEPLVRILYQRGAFSTSDTALVSQVLSMSVLQIPAYTAGIVGVRLLNAFNQNRVVALIGVCNMAANLFLNYLFMSLFGLPGIALSTAVVYVISAILIFAAVRRTFRTRLYFTPAGA